MMRDERRAGIRFGVAIARVALAITLASAASIGSADSSETAEEPDLAVVKAEWQTRFRDLRMQEAQLLQTIELATKEYADANRRTYRRSGVRHFHRTNADEAQVQLVVVRTRIERMFDEVVAAGGSLNWLYEVDDDPIDPRTVPGLGDYADKGRFGGKGAYGPPGAGEPDATAEEEDPDAGRNPLYTSEAVDEAGEGETDAEGELGAEFEVDADPDADPDAEEVPASLEEKPRPGFDYESWRKDRKRYEAERAGGRDSESDDY